MPKTITKKIFLQQPPVEIWAWLTESRLLSQWLMKNDFQPIVGHSFQFKDEQDPTHGVAHCEVLEVIPHKLISYTWKGNCHGEDFDSIVVWKLLAKPGGTELHLQHQGFTALEQLLSHGDGWENILTRLTEQLNPIHDVHHHA